jgi:hypothetical protein
MTPSQVPNPIPATVPRTPSEVGQPGVLPLSPPDSAPYIYANPWGGRHFDSVKVSLHCRENCAVIFSLVDSVHFQSYQERPFTFRRNTTLWISGIDSKGRQLNHTRIEYVIEKNPGACKGNTMPVPVDEKTVCMDAYEWPNREGEAPLASVSWQEAADFCSAAGKRLCTLGEWRAACGGPDRETYPYGGEYNERHCPAKEAAASRSGRFPACRSYYGVYDMTGNVWEWTATPSRDREDFFMVAGGNWDAGNDATCGLSKFSFYPQNRYPFVGFRCCQDATGP